MENLYILINYLLSGYPVCFPTDTVYALAADPCNADAVQKLYAMKGRENNKPISLLVDDIASIEQMAVLNKRAYQMIRRLDSCAPGYLTFVVSMIDDKYRLISSDGKLGIRITHSRTAREIIKIFGRPVAATSLNKSGEDAAISYDDIPGEFIEHCYILPDINREISGVASTVLDISDCDKLKILRVGAISEKKVMDILNDLLL